MASTIAGRVIARGLNLLQKCSPRPSSNWVLAALTFFLVDFFLYGEGRTQSETQEKEKTAFNMLAEGLDDALIL